MDINYADLKFIMLFDGEKNPFRGENGLHFSEKMILHHFQFQSLFITKMYTVQNDTPQSKTVNI